MCDASLRNCGWRAHLANGHFWLMCAFAQIGLFSTFVDLVNILISLFPTEGYYIVLSGQHVVCAPRHSWDCCGPGWRRAATRSSGW